MQEEGYRALVHTRPDGCAVVAVQGSLDAASAPRLATLLREQLDAGARLVVDLRGVDLIDSSGVRVLVEAWVRSARDPAAFAVQPPVRHEPAQVYAMTGLDSLFRPASSAG